eukprot:2446555-Pyramimonas_sp.AAC.1
MEASFATVRSGRRWFSTAMRYRTCYARVTLASQKSKVGQYENKSYSTSHSTSYWGVECILALIGTGGPTTSYTTRISFPPDVSANLAKKAHNTAASHAAARCRKPRYHAGSNGAQPVGACKDESAFLRLRDCEYSAVPVVVALRVERFVLPVRFGFDCCNQRGPACSVYVCAREANGRTHAPMWMLGAPMWMLGAPMWIVGAPMWMLGTPMWMSGAPMWMLGAPMWMLGATHPVVLVGVGHGGVALQIDAKRVKRLVHPCARAPKGASRLTATSRRTRTTKSSYTQDIQNILSGVLSAPSPLLAQADP